MEIAPFVPVIVDQGFLEVSPWYGYVLMYLGIYLAVTLFAVIMMYKYSNSKSGSGWKTFAIWTSAAGPALGLLLFGITGFAFDSYLRQEAFQLDSQKGAYVNEQTQSLNAQGVEIIQGELPLKYETPESSRVDHSNNTGVSLMLLKKDDETLNCVVSYPENIEDNLIFECSPVDGVKTQGIVGGK